MALSGTRSGSGRFRAHLFWAACRQQMALTHRCRCRNRRRHASESRAQSRATSHRAGFLKQRLRLANASGGRDTFGRAIRNAIAHAPLAQLDRASVYGTEGCRFEPCGVYLLGGVQATPLTLRRRCLGRMPFTSSKADFCATAASIRNCVKVRAAPHSTALFKLPSQFSDKVLGDEWQLRAQGVRNPRTTSRARQTRGDIR